MFAAPVDMAAEPGSLFTQFAVGGKGEYLKAAGIGQNRAVPAVELYGVLQPCAASSPGLR